MSTGLSGPTRPKRFLGSSLYIALLAYLGVIVGACLLYFVTQRQAANRKPKDQGNVASNPVAVPTTTSEKPPFSSAATKQSPSQPGNQVPDVPAVTPVQPPTPTREAIAVAELRWKQLRGQVEEMQKNLVPAVADAQTWTSLIEQLSEDDAGKRISSSKEHVEQYRRLLEQKRKPARLAQEYHDALNIHKETIKEYLAEPKNTTPPSDSLVQMLSQLQDDIKVLADEYHRDRRALENLVADTATFKPTNVTLAKAVEDREKAVAGEYLTQLTVVKEKAEAEAQKKLREASEKAIAEKAQAEADQRARLGAAEASRIRMETDQREREAKAEEERKKREAETKRLKALAEDPAIQRKYAAFLQKGYTRFNCRPSGGVRRRSDRPLPVSFGELNGYGWLKNSESFAKAMAKHRPNEEYNIPNDRPTHPYPQSSAEWEEMDKMLEQFKVLAPIWVEMKLLEP